MIPIKQLCAFTILLDLFNKFSVTLAKRKSGMRSMGPEEQYSKATDRIMISTGEGRTRAS